MSRKTRKLIWSAPLVAVLAVAGALAIFAAATPGGVFADALPGSPLNLTAEADGWYAIDLDWDPPSSGAPDGYRIDMSSNGFTWETLVMDTGNTRTNYTDEHKLKADTNRHYRVFALNSHGAGRVSNPTSEATDDPEAPKPVTRLRASNMGPDKIELSWTDPTDTGGLDIVQYCIRWSTTIGSMPTDCMEDADADNGGNGVILVDAEEATSPSCYAEPAGDVSMGTYIDSELDPRHHPALRSHRNHQTSGRPSYRPAIPGVRYCCGYHRRCGKARRPHRPHRGADSGRHVQPVLVRACRRWRRRYHWLSYRSKGG